MRRSVLLIEDENPTRKAFASSLEKAGWTVKQCADGKLALAALRSKRRFDVVLLDLKLPHINGTEVIERARQEPHPVPPVLVVSAHLGPKEFRKCLDLEVQGLAVLPKPVPPRMLPDLLEAFFTRNETALVHVPAASGGEPLQLTIVERKRKRIYLYRRRSDSGADLFKDTASETTESLNDEVQRREQALITYFKTQARKSIRLAATEPLLVVGRRWNSWYPSAFPVVGGAYAIMGAKAAEDATPGAVIDPGFRALSVLDSLGVPVGSLPRCIVTHNHPDHIGGVPEYMTARHVLGDPTWVFCAPGAKEMLASYAGGTVEVGDFNEIDVELVRPYEATGGKRRLRATPIKTAHFSVGHKDGTRGVVLTSELAVSNDRFALQSSCVLLGDTEFRPGSFGPNADLFKRMCEELARPEVRIAVVHIGCSQLKEGTGKHLYLHGLVDLLKDVDYVRSHNIPDAKRNRLLVLVSEWGLEHATAEQLAGALSVKPSDDLIQAFSRESLVVKTIDVIRSSWRFDTVTLLPADVGLTVGIESGLVYLKGVAPTRPEDVKVGWDENGLVYTARQGQAAGT